MTETIRVRIEVFKHKKSDLMMALSYDLEGLMVPGRTEEELQAKLPDAIRELLEAQGKDVVSITDPIEDPDFPPDFTPPSYISNAVIQG